MFVVLSRVGYTMAAIGVGIAIAPTASGWLVRKTSVLVALVSSCGILLIPLAILVVLPESLNYDPNTGQYLTIYSFLLCSANSLSVAFCEPIHNLRGT